MGFGKQHTGAIIKSHETQALGALGADTVILVGDVSPTEDFRILKSVLFGHITGLTAGEGQGLLLGIANGELSVAEIKESLEVDGPLDRNDRLAVEQAERFAKLFAAYRLEDITSTSGRFEGGDESSSPKMVIKPRWTFSDNEGWNYFIYNSGPAIQTGAAATIVSTHYGVWVT